MKNFFLFLILLTVYCTLLIDNCKAQVWSPLGSGMSYPNFPGVFALTKYNSELIAGGHFNIAGGDSANRIAKWNSGIGIKVIDSKIPD